MILRRTLLAFTALLALGSTAQAQTADHKALGQERFTLVAPFPPGGPIDTLARILADGLGKRYGQVAVVENLPGAAGFIGKNKVKRAKPDGHTLLVIPGGYLTINPTLMPKFPFDIEKDFAAITMLAKTPNVLVAYPGAKFKNVQELVTAAKKAPDTLSYASSGIGSSLHLAGELFKAQTDVEILHVAYKGTAPALNDVLSGTVPLMFSNLPVVKPHLQSGKLVALGVSDSTRSPAAPDIPTFAEQGVPGVVATSWYGLLAPGGTPAAVVEQLARDAREILNQPAVREQLQAQGMSENLMQPGEFAAYMRKETAEWARVIKSRGIKLD